LYKKVSSLIKKKFCEEFNLKIKIFTCCWELDYLSSLQDLYAQAVWAKVIYGGMFLMSLKLVR
jgi:hypothetical protein